MTSEILAGRGDRILRMPDHAWKDHVAAAPGVFAGRLAFMTPEHHRVRNFVVAELPANHGRPLPAADIARRLGLSIDGVRGILDDLERNLFFLVRNEAGAVSWAFPVTSDRTPHHVRFSNGKSTFSA